MPPATQKIETQNPEVRISSKQEALENPDSSEILTQKKDIPAIEVSDD